MILLQTTGPGDLVRAKVIQLLNEGRLLPETGGDLGIFSGLGDPITLIIIGILVFVVGVLLVRFVPTED